MATETIEKQDNKVAEDIKAMRLHDRCVEACHRMLEDREYIDVKRIESDVFDLVGIDSETNSFVFFQVNDWDKNITEEEERTYIRVNRPAFEQAAFEYFANEDDLKDIKFRFDIISIKVLSGNKAMVRHHVNAFNSTYFDKDTEE